MTDTHRRRFLIGLAASGPLLLPAPLLRAAGHFVLTPPQSAGPFYPDELPLDRDNDLTVVNDGEQAKGVICKAYRDSHHRRQQEKIQPNYLEVSERVA